MITKISQSIHAIKKYFQTTLYILYAFLTVSPYGMHLSMYSWIIDMGDPQKKRSKAYRMERRHVAVQSGEEDQNHL